MKTRILLTLAITTATITIVSMFVSYEAHAQQQQQLDTLTTAEKLRGMPCIGGDESGRTNSLTFHMLQGIPEDYRIISGYTTRGSVEMFFAGYKDCPRVTPEQAFDDGGIFYAEHRLYPPFSKKLYYEEQLQELEQRYEHAVTVSEYNGHPMIILDQQKIIQHYTSDANDSSNNAEEEPIPNYSQLRYVNTYNEHMITIRASGDPSKLIRMLDMTLNPSGPIVDHTRILALDEFAHDLWHSSHLIIDATITDIRDNNSEYQHAYDLLVNHQFKPLDTSFVGSDAILVYGKPGFEIEKGESGLFFIKREPARFVFGEHGAKITPECTTEMMYHKSRLLHPSTELVHESEFIAEDAVRCYPAYYRNYLPEFIEAHEKSVANPRMQIENGVLPYHVACREDLNLLLKPPEFDMPACVTDRTADKLADRGWMKFVPIQPKIGKTGQYDLESNSEMFEIKYHVKGSSIKEIYDNRDENMVNVVLESPYNGILQISLPRDLIDSKAGGNDDGFIVLVDGVEVLYTETTDKHARTLAIEFEKDSELIQIIGNNPNY